MSNNGTVQKVSSAVLARLNIAEVLVGWTMLFISLRESGMFQGDPQIMRLLDDAAAGKAQVWILRNPEKRVLIGVLVSKIFDHPYHQERAFTIVHAHVHDGNFVEKNVWLGAFKTLTKYAKRHGCTYAEIYSENARVKQLLEAFGFAPASVYRREL